MQMLELIGFLLLFQLPVVDAEFLGSRSFFESAVSSIGIGVFTFLLGALLVYACLVDVKHWLKSIDGHAQLGYPNLSPTEFQLPPMYGFSEEQADSQEPNSTTLIEKTPQEDKTLRIVKAMYTSSNREVPEVIQKSLKSKSTVNNQTQRPTVTLQTISEEIDTSN